MLRAHQYTRVVGRLAGEEFGNRTWRAELFNATADSLLSYRIYGKRTAF